MSSLTFWSIIVSTENNHLHLKLNCPQLPEIEYTSTYSLNNLKEHLRIKTFYSFVMDEIKSLLNYAYYRDIVIPGDQVITAMKGINQAIIFLNWTNEINVNS